MDRAKKKIISDFLLNILSTGITIGVMQIIIYPGLAKNLSKESNGTFLTIMGIVNTMAIATGNTLNNTRLVQNSKYAEMDAEGDFNPIIFVSSVLSSFVMCIIGFFVFKTTVLTGFLMTVLLILMPLREYFIVAYRIKLDYKNNLICNVCISFGYLVGLGLSYITNEWPFPFIIGELAGLIWILITSKIMREKYCITPLFKSTLGKYLILISVSIVANATIYLDRLILYPIFGGETVSVYYSAAFFGKLLGAGMVPIASVLLSYLSQKGSSMTLKKFWQTNVMVIAIGGVFLMIATMLSPFAVKLLYPQFYDEAKQYFFIANLIAVVDALDSMVQPAILKFAPTYLQPVNTVIYSVIYLTLGVVLISVNGVMGFCQASLIAKLAKVLFNYMIGTILFKKKT